MSPAGPPALTDVLLTLARRLHEQIKHRGEKTMISPVQMHALLAIQAKNRPTMRDISQCLAITPPSGTVLVKELEKQGLIQRIPDPSDRRVVHLSVTSHGKEVLDTRIKLVSAGIEELAVHLTAEERTQLITLLTKLTSTESNV